MPIITQQIIEQGKSSNNGWNYKQISILGDDMRIRGWQQRLIGKDVTQRQIDEFLLLKDSHLKRGKIIKAKKHSGLLTFVPVVPGTLKWADQYLHPNWQKYRAYILKRDQYRCVNCKAQHSTLHVHHLKYASSGFIWDVPHWYLVSLCDRCHAEEHGRQPNGK